MRARTKAPRTLVLTGALYRVVRAGWFDPLDATWSQTMGDRRWNTVDFPALYCCRSLDVARAVTRDLLGWAGIDLADLQPAYRPRLVEVGWSGEVVDVATAPGVAAAGFPESYPEGVTRGATHQAAVRWHRQGRQGVACRSASLGRLGLAEWSGPPERWSEVALFVETCGTPPVLLGHRDDAEWLRPGGTGSFESAGGMGGGRPNSDGPKYQPGEEIPRLGEVGGRGPFR